MCCNTEHFFIRQFAARWKELYAEKGDKSSVSKSNSKYSRLWQELEGSDAEDSNAVLTVESSPKPWKKEFLHWMEHDEVVPDGMDVVTWWGVSGSSNGQVDIDTTASA